MDQRSVADVLILISKNKKTGLHISLNCNYQGYLKTLATRLVDNELSQLVNAH